MSGFRCGGIYMDRMWWAAPTIGDVKPVNCGADDGWAGMAAARPAFQRLLPSFSQARPAHACGDKIILYNPSWPIAWSVTGTSTFF